MASSFNNNRDLNLTVLVSGRGTNLQAILDATAQGRIKSRVTHVISNKEGAIALERAHKVGVKTIIVPSKGRPAHIFFKELIQTLQNISPDLIVLAGFMKILPSEMVSAFEGRMINIHPSLLPAFPGLDAQKQALETGVKVTGCTVHYVNQGCDTGPILIQKTTEVKNDDTLETLSERLLLQEHEALIEAITLIEQHKVILQGRKTLLRK